MNNRYLDDPSSPFFHDDGRYNEWDITKKVEFLSVQPAAMREMTRLGKLAQLDTPSLSLLVSSYAMNICAVDAAKGVVRPAWTEDIVTKTMRQEICLGVAKNPILMKKLYPAARMSLLSFLKKHPFATELNYFKHTLDLSVQQAIDNAYDIPTNYNPELKTWNKALWPATVGFGTGDFIGRRNELIMCAIDENPQYIEAKDDPKAAAELLVTDPRLSEKLSDMFALYLNDNTRYKLADKYPHITRMLLENPEYRGCNGEITADQLKELAQKHNCIDAYNKSDLSMSSNVVVSLTQFSKFKPEDTKRNVEITDPTHQQTNTKSNSNT